MFFVLLIYSIDVGLFNTEQQNIKQWFLNNESIYTLRFFVVEVLYQINKDFSEYRSPWLV